MGNILTVIAFLEAHWDLIATLLPATMAIIGLTKWGQGHKGQAQTAQQVIDILTGTIEEMKATKVKAAVSVKDALADDNVSKALHDSLDRIAQK